MRRTSPPRLIKSTLGTHFDCCDARFTSETGQQQTHALQQNQRAANRKTASRRSLRNPVTASAAFFRLLRQPSRRTRVTPPGPPCRRSTSQSQRRHRPGIMFARRRARGDARGQRDVSPVIPGGVLVLLALADADFACPLLRRRRRPHHRR
jgi:hypothetical protein